MISLLRIPLGAALLAAAPFSAAFYLIWALCGASDALDGLLARRLGLVSALGQRLDTLADLVFYGALLYIMIRYAAIPRWGLWWALIVAAVRLLSALVNLAKYGRPALLHTAANKLAGLLLFLFPALIGALGAAVSTAAVCLAAALSSLEELALSVTSKELDLDKRSLFFN